MRIQAIVGCQRCPARPVVVDGRAATNRVGTGGSGPVRTEVGCDSVKQTDRTADGRAGRSTSGAAQVWSQWGVMVGFGAVSLAADMVYEGAR